MELSSFELILLTFRLRSLEIWNPIYVWMVYCWKGEKLSCFVIAIVLIEHVGFLVSLTGTWLDPCRKREKCGLVWPFLSFPCRRTATHHQAEALEPLWCTCGKIWLAPWRCSTVYRFPHPNARNGSRKTSISWRMPSASLVEFLADFTNIAFWASKCFPVLTLDLNGDSHSLTGLQVSWLHPQTFILLWGTVVWHFAFVHCDPGEG